MYRCTKLTQRSVQSHIVSGTDSGGGGVGCNVPSTVQGTAREIPNTVHSREFPSMRLTLERSNSSCLISSRLASQRLVFSRGPNGIRFNSRTLCLVVITQGRRGVWRVFILILRVHICQGRIAAINKPWHKCCKKHDNDGFWNQLKTILAWFNPSDHKLQPHACPFHFTS